MKSEPVIHLTDVPSALSVEELVRRRVARLDRYCEDIESCHVWVAAPHGHHKQGRLYEVRLRIGVPDGVVVVRDQPADDDVHVAIRGAFDAARRQLEDHVRRRRGDVKEHPRAAAGARDEQGGETP